MAALGEPDGGKAMATDLASRIGFDRERFEREVQAVSPQRTHGRGRRSLESSGILRLGRID
jgi:hypothetical protein